MTLARKKENSEARDAILSSVRSHLAKSQPFDAEYAKHHHETAATTAAARSDVGDATSEFIRNAEAVGARCLRVGEIAAAAKYINDVCGKGDAKRIALSNSPLAKAVLEAGVRSQGSENDAAGELFGVDVGVTGAQWGIAETGTLVIESDAENNRLISLIPPVHICIIEGRKIRRTMGEILELTSESLSPAVTFITGASRTSDIELTLAIGVHGPKELHIIVIDDEIR